MIIVTKIVNLCIATHTFSESQITIRFPMNIKHVHESIVNKHHHHLGPLGRKRGSRFRIVFHTIFGAKVETIYTLFNLFII